MQESLFNDMQPNDLRQPQLHKANVVGSTGRKDWTGNNKSVFSTLGASSHSKGERQKHDFYATDPKAIEWLLKLETFTDVWECACGQGHLSKVLMDAGIHKRSTDTNPCYAFGLLFNELNFKNGCQRYTALRCGGIQG